MHIRCFISSLQKCHRLSPFASPCRCQQPWLLLLSVSWETNLGCTDQLFYQDPTFAIVPRSPWSHPPVLAKSQLWGCGPRSESLGPQDHPLNFHSAFYYAWTKLVQISGNNQYQWLVSSHPSKSLLTMCACSVMSNTVTRHYNPQGSMSMGFSRWGTGVSCHSFSGYLLTDGTHLLHLLH